MSEWYPSFSFAVSSAITKLKNHGQIVDSGAWQGVATEGRPDLVTKELINLSFQTFMTPDLRVATAEIQPSLPWADDHFAERVSRVPSNPGEEYKNWPWWHGQDEHAMRQVHQTSPEEFDLVFDHTYQERFWPRSAGEGDSGPYRTYEGRDNWGIRYEYGDLDDVVNQLFENPPTRQATFPIFFPEDTGAVHGGRVPCTLHYHFLMRNNKLHMWYPIRSCDAVRHFRDDLYMAVRLNNWVLDELLEKELRSDGPQVWVNVEPGMLYFTAYSFHVHMGDYHLL